MNGQKVVKVFCHEKEAKRRLRRRSTMPFFPTSEKANRYANMLMPILFNIGNVLVCCCGRCGRHSACSAARRT